MAKKRESQEPRAIPDVDVDGFAALDELAQRARAMPEGAFAQAYFAPALRVDAAPEAAPAGSGDRLEASYRRTTDEDVRLPDTTTVLLRYAGRAAFLTKRPGNLFPEMISIGRALNCDVVLALTSVSKIHGLFHREADGKWSYSDQASRNGTQLNGRKLEPGARHALADGDRLKIGLHLTCVFCEPTSLRARLLEAR